VSAITARGARPFYTEIDPATMLLDVTALETMLTTLRDPKIKAVVPVHLYARRWTCHG